MKKFFGNLARKIEFILLPGTLFSAYLMKSIRRYKFCFIRNWNLLKRLEVIPVINHYYEPLISRKQLKKTGGAIER